MTIESKYPHHPAAFINTIADEGSKAEAINFLQLTWDELCFIRSKLEVAEWALEELRMPGLIDADDCLICGFSPDRLNEFVEQALKTIKE